ncbi:AI-2E family transporter [Legionella sp. W05-934-2]|jgi:predicted PurR-regulated permease PerM|uniref:AI-2E family transporter n=1 Tax=Legionella sp. W05-934-2 TaxID=1198649 RepID=UPI0034624FAC
MNENHRELVSIGLTLAIVVLTIFIIHRFIPSIIWAAIIVIATFPLYRRWQKYIPGGRNTSALLFTSLLAFVFVIPLTWLISLLYTESQLFINYLQTVNRHGGEPPELLHHIPLLGDDIYQLWQEKLGEPGRVRELLANLHISLASYSYYIKQIGANLLHRGFQLGFTLLTLFFFFRDGEKLYRQIQLVGEYCLGKRWFRYADKLPAALRGTVNGTIVVGLGVGILMGVCYGLVGFPAPTLTGFITAICAMIPFVVPVVFAVVAMILLSMGKLIAALIIIGWGTLVMFVADHFIKPALIGGSIKLPFLAVLFGILGGVETLGLLGLFLGPIIMVLFLTLWMEPYDKLDESTIS